MRTYNSSTSGSCENDSGRLGRLGIALRSESPGRERPNVGLSPYSSGLWRFHPVPRHHRITETCNHRCAAPRCAHIGKCFSRILLGPRCSTLQHPQQHANESGYTKIVLMTMKRARRLDGDLGTLVGYNPNQPKNANWYALARHWELPTYSKRRS